VKPAARTSLSAIALLAALSAANPILAATPGTEPRLADSALLPAPVKDFLLDGPWIYKANRRSKDLMAEDLNGDGLLDVAVVSNERSILELFFQQKAPKDGEPLFKKETLNLDRIISRARAIDVNGDGRMDLAMAGAPPRLIVMYQGEDGRLQPPQQTDIEASRLIVGDLNADGRPDLLVYNNKRFDILPGKARGLELESSQTFHTTGDPASDPMILDFDGDGLADIVYHDSGAFGDLVVRLQTAEKSFPSEFRATTSLMRVVAPLVGGKGERDTVVAVQNTTRSLVQLGLAEPDEKENATKVIPTSAMQTVSFDPESRSGKTFQIVADYDGDGRLDVLLFSPDLSVARILRQTRGGSLVETRVPSFQGITAALPLPAKKGSPTPLVLFSPAEKAVGYTVADAKTGVLPFPSILPIAGEPLGVAVVSVGNKPHIAVALKAEGSGKTPRVDVYPISDSGELGTVRTVGASGGDGPNPLEGVDVIGMEAMDTNRDGLDDLIVYADFKPATILLQGKDSDFQPLRASSGVLQGLLSGARATSLDDVRLSGADKPASVAALKEKFARAFHIDAENNVVVEQQFNGRNAQSRLVSFAVGSPRGEGTADMVLLDRGNKVLTVYGIEKGKAEYELLVNIDIDGSEYNSLRVFDLDGDGKDDFLLTAEDRLGVIYSRPLSGGLRNLATVELEDSQSGYGMVFPLRLFPGGPTAMAAVERKNMVLDLDVPGKGKEGHPALHRFYSFKMFDNESTIARRINLDAVPEPREGVAVDVNNDGKPEIITLMHDNIVIYYPVDKKTEAVAGN